MIDIFAKNIQQLEVLFTQVGIERFRAKQVFHWLYERKVFDFHQMNNIGKQTQTKLAENFTILMNDIGIIQTLKSKDRNTYKSLLNFADNNTCETVLMCHDYGNSVCVSSQIGCAMGCSFCASGLNGFIRNLSSAEMLAQVMHFATKLQDEQKRISHVVIMGSGEPLLNLKEVLQFIKLLHDPNAFNISYRNITLSTSGIVPAIKTLQAESLPINLAISLHATTDEKRSSIMPINKTYPLTELLSATKEYANVSGRQVTYEYILINGFNDTLEDAARLIELLSAHTAVVNLIPFNDVKEHSHIQTPIKRAQSFKDYLQKHGTPATIRKEMGADINAACGQLRNKHIDTE